MINGLIKSQNGTQIIVTIPKISITTTQGIQVSVKGQFGEGTSTNKFTYNPATTTTNASAVPLNTTGASQQTQTEIVKTQSSTRQEIGPKVMIENQIKGIGGMENLTVTINPDAGVWKLQSQPDLKLQLVTLSSGPNNTTKETRTSIATDRLVGFVSNDFQKFFITNFDVIKYIEEDFEKEEVKAASYVVGQVELIADPANTSNAQQHFNVSFTIKLKI